MLKRYFSTSIPSSSILVELTKTPGTMRPLKELQFGKDFTDHMLTIEYDNGWKQPKIQPFHRLSLHPSVSALHYGLQCFEGMKAYKDKNGAIRLFRPDMNMKRMRKSVERLTLPSFNEDQLLECVKKLVKVEDRWIPSERGYSLYIRPTMIATQESLGVGASSRALFFTICSPVGPYYRTGFAAVSLLADPAKIRGVGDCKVGGNYAPGIQSQQQAMSEGFQQNLWLFPNPNTKENMLTEVGTMNLFVLWKVPKSAGSKEFELELVTPPLDGTILPGVTRDSILELAKGWKEFKVSEKPISIEQIIKASKENRLVEMFGAGTAAIVSPIKQIRFVKERENNGKVTKFEDIMVPLDPKNPQSQAGPLAKRIMDTILGIQYGEIPHKWSVVV